MYTGPEGLEYTPVWATKTCCSSSQLTGKSNMISRRVFFASWCHEGAYSASINDQFSKPDCTLEVIQVCAIRWPPINTTNWHVVISFTRQVEVVAYAALAARRINHLVSGDSKAATYTSTWCWTLHKTLNPKGPSTVILELIEKTWKTRLFEHRERWPLLSAFSRRQRDIDCLVRSFLHGTSSELVLLLGKRLLYYIVQTIV